MHLAPDNKKWESYEQLLFSPKTFWILYMEYFMPVSILLWEDKEIVVQNLPLPETRISFMKKV